MYSNSFDYEVDDFHFAVEEFLEDTEYMGICESLLLPVEEGIGDSFKKALNYLYKKFHAILEAFKRWVKKVINKVKSFFTRGKKKNSREKTDALVDRLFSEDPIVVKKTPTGKEIPLPPEEAKKVVEDMNDVLKTANIVESELKKASSDENVTKEEADTVTKKADDVSKQMSELKLRVETTYLALPQKTETGIAEDKKRKEVEKYREKLAEKAKDAAEDDYSKNADDQARQMAWDMVKKNFFKFKNNSKDIEIPVYHFIIRVGEIETGKQVVFSYKTRIDTCASHILDVIGETFENVDGARDMLKYMNQRIPRQLQEYIGKNKKEINSLKKELSNIGTKNDPDYEYLVNSKGAGLSEMFNLRRKFRLMIRIFRYQPNMQNLNNIIEMIFDNPPLIKMLTE